VALNRPFSGLASDIRPRGDAYVDRSGRCNAQIARDIADVGKRLIDVAVLHRRHIDLALRPYAR